MASSSTHRAASSSSSSSTTTSRNYDVFLTFKGDDIRKNFLDHLYTTLTAYGVVTFRDDEELETGGHIASDLSRAIQESKIFLIVFSKNYAYSGWCLNELLKIIELKNQKERMVLPIFYHVDPSDVRNQRGSFGDALAYHGRDENQEKKEMIPKWRIALRQAADLVGWHVDDQYETEVIKKIVDRIMGILNHQPLNVGKNIVGINAHLENLKILLMNTELNKVNVIGICGTGGAGKTTIAKAIYNEISYQYDGSSFLRNIKERSKSELLQLQQELLHGILRGKNCKINNIDEGTSMIKRCLSSNRVLVIFDDVDELEQLEYLAEEEWFEVKSTIIFTSRHKQVLAQYGANIYEVPKLNKGEAIELFSLWAFKQNLPKEAYRNLSYNIIDYADGLPLALQVLGASLFGKKISEWESALWKLQTIPDMKIYNVLKISFDGLDDIDKGIFLDVACFFKGHDKDFVSRILGPHVEYGIATLDDRCLINTSKNKLDMHDLIQKMGWEIIRQECPEDPGRRSRLWDSNAYHVLTRNMVGTQTIEGLFLDRCKFNPLQLTVESFKEMKRLRLLKIHNAHRELSLEEHLPRGFEFSSYELTYLHWDGYSLESLPVNFHAKNLVEVSLRDSKIKKLWSKDKVHSKLKVIDLSYSIHLIEIPNCSSVPNLESLTLEGCINLEVLPRGIYKWKHLRNLSCNGCLKLERLPEIRGNMGKLTVLNLSRTAIMDLPSSITRLRGLRTLLLEDCSKLLNMPIHICQLSSLEVLGLGRCNIMEGGIPSEISHLSSLQKLNLEGGHFSSIPTTINQLSRLKALNLSHCNNLEQVPELPSSLQLLDAHGSNGASPSAPFLPLHSLDLEGTSVSSSSYHGKGLCIVLPGSDGIPGWIMKRRYGFVMTADLPQNWYQNDEFWGFALCCVFVPLGHESEDIPEKESAPGSYNESEDESEDEYADFPFCKKEHKQTYSRHLKGTLVMVGDRVEMVDFPLFQSNCFCFKEYKEEDDENISGQTLVLCYSKAVIQEKVGSEEWTQIGTIFEDFYGGSDKAFKVMECGVNLIYSQDLQQSQPLTTQTENADFRICNACQRNGALRRKRCFKGSDMTEVPIIENPSELDVLCLRDCKNLTSLPSGIFYFKSLAILSCSGCSQLESFPEILEDMHSLRKLYLDGTAIKELPSSIQRLRGLQTLFLTNCKNLVNLPENICNLTSFKTLVVNGCPNFNKLPDNLGRLKSIERLFVGNLGLMDFQLPSMSGLYSLTELMLYACNLKEIPDEICQLSSLQSLGLKGNHFSCIPDGISQLYNLEDLDLSHCKMLQHIPELPSSLRHLDAHHCTSLQNLSSQSCLIWSSLFKCFKSQIQGVEVKTFIPGSNGIPEWISHQRSGSKIKVELPCSWYENDDFLGFVLCSLHGPFDIEWMRAADRAEVMSFSYVLNFDDGGSSVHLDDIRFEQLCEYCYYESESKNQWLIYYYKSNIPKKYHSNEWRTLKASFYGYFGIERMKVEQCGFHFLYAHDYEHSNLGIAQGNSSSLDDLGGHRSVVQDTNSTHSQGSCGYVIQDPNNFKQENRCSY